MLPLHFPQLTKGGGTTLEDRLLDVEEVAEYLRLPERTISTLAKDGTLRGFKLQNKWRFRRADVEEYIRQAANREGSST